MKGSKIPIRKVNSGQNRWMVDLRYVGGRRLFFKTQDQAEEARAAKMSEVQRHGASAFALSDRDRLEFIKASERLEKLKVGINDVIDFYEKHHRIVGDMVFDDAIWKIYDIKTQTNKRSRSSEQFRYSLQSLARALPGKMLHEIHRDDIEKWLYGNAWGPATIRTKLIDVQTFFRAALSRGWIIADPTEGIERVRLDDKPPGILSIQQVASLMNSAQVHAPEFCGFLALALFCGIRPEELEGMALFDVNLERGYAEVRAEVSKTRQRRLVDLSANCVAWINVGLQLPPVNARGKLNVVRKKAGFCGYRKEREKWIKVPGEEWPHDATRHSFASYHLAFHGSADKTALQMGHRSTEMLFRHYRELVPKQEAEKFWSIMPTVDLRK